MKKILLVVGIVILVLLAGVSIVVGFYLGPIVKVGLEQVGSKVAQVSITVGAVDLSILSGSAAVKNLKVGNPSGYSSPEAFSVGTVAVSLAPMSVMSSKVLVHSIHVESPEITFEGGLSGNNLSKLQSNVSNYGSSNNTQQPATPATNAAPAGQKPAPKIEVDDFLITGAKVHVIISGMADKLISIPDIHLTDLGKDTGGMTQEELTTAVLKAVSVDTITAVTTSISGLTQSVGNLGKQVISGGVSTIASGIGDLLGNK